MDNSIGERDESRYFDAKDHVVRELDFSSDVRNWQYDVWIGAPQSVGDRRRKFIRWIGENSAYTFDNAHCDYFDIHRIMENGEAVLRTPSVEDEFWSSRTSMSSWNAEDLYLFERGQRGNRNVDFDGVDGFDSNLVVGNEISGEVQVMGLERLQSSRDFGDTSRCSSPFSQFKQKGIEVDGSASREGKKLKNKWLDKLRSMSCMMSVDVKDDNLGVNGFSLVEGTRIKRVRVRHSRKRSKELSALFIGQDIQAHEGAITTMKFSLDGQYLASAGEDKIIRIWQVVEDERLDAVDIPEADPSCVYFSENQLSELGPLVLEKGKMNKSNNMRKTQDSACIVFPSKVFRILEKPLHVFQGHTGEILNLSWSKNNCLLSSSVDKTVRLWRVGIDQCDMVFPHSDYVTCIQFNPTNSDYFISGSIDGKVRIWHIGSSKVIAWKETKDIVTAVSYRPDGQGGIIGSMSGTCCYFNLSDDNEFQLGNQVSVTSKKKSPCKRVTAFEFSSHDPSKVLVTCADSKVRIIDGVNLIEKYKGLRTGGNQISASFTSDGKHIVSASDDSNVYIWNFDNQGESSISQPKAIRSYECFPSDASVAIPWSGLETGNSVNSLPFSPSTLFSLSPDYFLESSSKVSATWPEEKLPVSAATSPLSKSQYKFVKSSCQNSTKSHAWGLVIVTAGWDGRIRTYQNYGLPVSF